MTFLNPGGTGYQPVLGGNLPPSFGTESIRRIAARNAHEEQQRAGRPLRRASGPFHPDMSWLT
jgi:hypothetical protein